METRLVAKGKGEPREGLVEQGREHVRLAKQFAKELDEAGWTQDATAELDWGVARLESEEARAVERLGAADSPHAEVDRKAAPDDVDGAFARDLVRKAAPKIAEYVERMRGAAAALDEKLNAGNKAAEALSALERALERAAAPTEMGGAGASANALAIFATKGRVLEMVELLNEVAGRVFKGRPEVLAKFNTELLDRARGALGAAKEKKVAGTAPQA
jgi:hypothetical protein